VPLPTLHDFQDHRHRPLGQPSAQRLSLGILSASPFHHVRRSGRSARDVSLDECAKEFVGARMRDELWDAARRSLLQYLESKAATLLASVGPAQHLDA